ncbi:glutamate synthase (NADPH/NADH) large chain [Geothermobacter ehrlichii]|uniref:Glutamate synthase (NADPH/NADH) large chain n=1 Tax=Geothermobacter ehrlichii TaxID=213224 RepID=A0A5D3WQM6_9BACT|nr:glutamate synthase large subunit [Geothermobacter ehrlichii]TYO99888.1 glutamate synthase (NADPH/NADH) large chain [Geothermobacter ehrlichii]
MNLGEQFKDSCGMGLVAHLKNSPGHDLVEDGIRALRRMVHRGAIAADGKTGDGCGLLCSMPVAFMRRVAEEEGVSLPDTFAVATLFLQDAEKEKTVFSESCARNDLRVLLFREVPVNTSALGDYARQRLPEIVQAFVVPNELIATRRFDALIYLSRREAEKALASQHDFYIANFSRHLVSYKGLVMPDYLQELYPDLQAADFASSFVLFHQRFSTNTLPRWPLAQPLRNLAHNGEINSIRANRFNALAKSAAMKSPVFSEEELERLLPILAPEGSDSASLDNMFEFLLVNGIDFFKAVRMLIPPARHNVAHMPAKLRSFYEYTSAAWEPWDGPAAVCMTNGRYVGCVLDRNGLRPAKWVITTEDKLLLTSEYGVLGTPPEKVRRRGRLQSGEMIAADLEQGEIFFTRDIDRYLMNSQPYSQWLTDNTYYLQEFIELQFQDLSDYDYPDLPRLQRYHNVTNETVEQMIKPMLRDGREPTGSMGDDTPMAAFSDQQRNFADFFRQKFAQVTNPPIDPYREKVVMSTTIGIGEIGNPLIETPDRGKRLKSISPILSLDIFKALLSFGDPDRPRYDPAYRHQTFSTGFRKDLRQALTTLGDRVTEAVRDGVRVVLLDDRCLDTETRLIPMPMVVGYLNQRLLDEKLRHLASLVAITGEVTNPHHACVLIGYGATAIYPWLVYATGLQMLRRNGADNRATRIGLKNIYDALTKGILKVMSKMGISTVSSYRNAALFDIIGLSEEVVASCFPASPALLPGLGFDDLEERIARVHRKVFAENRLLPVYPLEVGSLNRDNPGGEYHDFHSRIITGLHAFAESRRREDYLKVRRMLENRGEKFVRDFLHLTSDRPPIPVEEVEPVEAITRRFDSAAMSLGSISPEAHQALAEAMRILGGCSNSGEGGEAPERLRSNLNSRIKQIASGRFGVTPAYLRSAEEIQIKVAQGAKPGEGGQLPGEKVTPLIASLRYTMPGVTLISPPPHHDIYSIEDLAQLIFDLKQVNPSARVSVKLVSSEGVGTIAAGVAKCYADRIIISGSDGGTGAAPQTSIKHAGNPWELGLAEANQSLKANDLRELVELQTDGGLKIGRDIVKAALLGAEYYGFGTPLLVMLGCKLLRICHLNRCTVGVATQEEVLRSHFVGTVQKVVSYLTNVAEDVREILAGLGYRSLDEIIGRVDLLRPSDSELAKKFDFSAVLSHIEGINRKTRENRPFDDNAFEKDLLREVDPVIKNPQEEIVVEREILNTNRSVGALISGEIARYYGDTGLPKDAITLRLKGVAGQSLGAFLINGVSIFLDGVGNDYVGKGMAGGRIIITPGNYYEGVAGAGNTCLYGATGGKLFVAGTVGERFAVRNSGALAVVEGTGDHACEYMTGGTVVILGDTGINFGAGMTGGVAFIYDRKKDFIDKLNTELVEARRIDVDEDNEGKLYLKKILVSYHNRTRSPKARYILDNYREELAYFWMVRPRDMKAPLNPKEGD